MYCWTEQHICSTYSTLLWIKLQRRELKHKRWKSEEEAMAGKRSEWLEGCCSQKEEYEPNTPHMHPVLHSSVWIRTDEGLRVCLCTFVLAESGGWQMVRAECCSPAGPSFLSPSLPRRFPSSSTSRGSLPALSPTRTSLSRTQLPPSTKTGPVSVQRSTSIKGWCRLLNSEDVSQLKQLEEKVLSNKQFSFAGELWSETSTSVAFQKFCWTC